MVGKEEEEEEEEKVRKEKKKKKSKKKKKTRARTFLFLFQLLNRSLHHVGHVDVDFVLSFVLDALLELQPPTDVFSFFSHSFLMSPPLVKAQRLNYDAP